ncbi:MAG: alpha/beta hydrolase domain-containing protein [Lachnospiraceae bacterium]|nr:alpha/beta hydrolase domain-containing protein [Lachnospiraceae bacterium]
MAEIKRIVQQTAWQLPEVEGPILVTDKSHPFCAMAYSRVPLNVENFDYVEEEYFLSGFANVYDADSNDQLIIKKEKLPYKNRILVRRPKSESKFSGRVYVDIMNATQGYDIEDMWHRNYLWCMEHGHVYVGVTSKPINVLSLKNFDYDRYSTLNWSSGEMIPYPAVSKSATIPGTEEGLVWDIISQTVALLRKGGNENCLGGYQVKYVYLSGQSQSGAYLNTYISYFDSILNSRNNERLCDGYFNVVGALVQRSLCQQNEVGPLKLLLRHMHPSTSPYICLSSEADLSLFSMFVPNGNLLDIKIENVNLDDNKCRYYEISGTPHTDIICPILSSIEEIEKTGTQLPNLSTNLLEHINDIPVEYYICGLLEKLHLWAKNGEAPEIFEPLYRENGKIKRDKAGNALGGLRTPFVDVPIATYVASNPEDPEGICGKMKYFTLQEVEKRYGSVDEYLQLFAKETHQQIEDGWISQTDGMKMIKWSKEAVKKLSI